MREPALYQDSLLVETLVEGETVYLLQQMEEVQMTGKMGVKGVIWLAKAVRL